MSDKYKLEQKNKPTSLKNDPFAATAPSIPDPHLCSNPDKPTTTKIDDQKFLAPKKTIPTGRSITAGEVIKAIRSLSDLKYIAEKFPTPYATYFFQRFLKNDKLFFEIIKPYFSSVHYRIPTLATILQCLRSAKIFSPGNLIALLSVNLNLSPYDQLPEVINTMEEAGILTHKNFNILLSQPRTLNEGLFLGTMALHKARLLNDKSFIAFVEQPKEYWFSLGIALQYWQGHFSGPGWLTPKVVTALIKNAAHIESLNDLLTQYVNDALQFTRTEHLLLLEKAQFASSLNKVLLHINFLRVKLSPEIRPLLIEKIACMTEILSKLKHLEKTGTKVTAEIFIEILQQAKPAFSEAKAIGQLSAVFGEQNKAKTDIRLPGEDEPMQQSIREKLSDPFYGNSFSFPF